MTNLQQQIQLKLEVCLQELDDLSEYEGYIKYLEEKCILSKSHDLMMDILRLSNYMTPTMEEDDEDAMSKLSSRKA
jgi:hypothetical protein